MAPGVVPEVMGLPSWIDGEDDVPEDDWPDDVSIERVAASWLEALASPDSVFVPEVSAAVLSGAGLDCDGRELDGVSVTGVCGGAASPDDESDGSDSIETADVLDVRDPLEDVMVSVNDVSLPGGVGVAAGVRRHSHFSSGQSLISLI